MILIRSPHNHRNDCLRSLNELSPCTNNQPSEHLYATYNQLHDVVTRTEILLMTGKDYSWRSTRLTLKPTLIECKVISHQKILNKDVVPPLTDQNIKSLLESWNTETSSMIMPSSRSSVM